MGRQLRQLGIETNADSMRRTGTIVLVPQQWQQQRVHLEKGELRRQQEDRRAEKKSYTPVLILWSYTTVTQADKTYPQKSNYRFLIETPRKMSIVPQLGGGHPCSSFSQLFSYFLFFFSFAVKKGEKISSKFIHIFFMKQWCMTLALPART